MSKLKILKSAMDFEIFSPYFIMPNDGKLWYESVIEGISCLGREEFRNILNVEYGPEVITDDMFADLTTFYDENCNEHYAIALREVYNMMCGSKFPLDSTSE